MGWLYGWNSRAELIKERTSEKQWMEGYSGKLLAHTAVGNVLWTAWEITKPDQTTERYIGCDLLQKNGGAWGYKDMEESMHPYYYSCPLKYLDLVPVASEEWRKGVREYHAKRARKFSVGEVVKLVEGCKPPEVTITQVKPLTGMYNGRLYKVSLKHVA